MAVLDSRRARVVLGTKRATEKLLSTGHLAAQLRKFAEERDWEQFHSPKNLVMALMGEVGELAEFFQWATRRSVPHRSERPSHGAGGTGRTRRRDSLSRLADALAAKVQADLIIRNTYLTLMTRGMKGCYVFATDPGVRDLLRLKMHGGSAGQWQHADRRAV